MRLEIRPARNARSKARVRGKGRHAGTVLHRPRRPDHSAAGRELLRRIGRARERVPL